MSSQRRKPVGLAALTSRTSTASTYATHGSTLRSAHLSALEAQLSVFQSLLQNFSIQHSKQIKSNPTFRAEFARMCNAIGVDPLASNNKTAEGGNWWAQVLGKEVGDFYFELAVRIVEVCRRSRKIDGGLVAVDVVRERVPGVNGEKVSEDDIVRAVESLKPLGSGFTLVNIGRRRMIRSVPKELNTDQSTLLDIIQIQGFVTVSMLQINLQWERARSRTVIDDLMSDSLLWVDMQAEEAEYWSPTVIHDSSYTM